MKLHKPATSFGVAVLLTSLAACGTGGNATPTSNGDTFVLAVAADPQNLDPHGSLSLFRGNLQMTRLLYDPLVNLAPDGTVLPGLAGSWQVRGSTVVFRLRPGVTCSDDTELTAGTVAANFDHVRDPANGSPMLGIGIPADLKVSSDATARTVTLTSSSTPPVFLLNELSIFGIVCPDGLKDRNRLRQGADGTGPYTLSKAVAGSEYRLAKRSGHTWGPGRDPAGSPPATIVVRVIANETTATNLLVSKQINAAHIRGAEQARLRGAGLTARTYREPIGQLWFNQRKGHLTADEKVRAGLVEAADLAPVMKAATQSPRVASQGMLLEPLVCGGTKPASALRTFDRAAAEASLRAAGWDRTDGRWSKDGRPLAVTFLHPSSLGPSVASAVELLAERWKAFGVDVKLKSATDAEFGQALFTTGDWDVSWGVTTPKVPTQLLPFVSGPQPPKGRNWAGIDNDRYNAITAAGGSSDPNCGAWNEAEMSLYSSTSVVPLEDIQVPVFTNNATFELGGIGGQILANTLRLR